MYFGILKIKMDAETTNEYSYSHAVNICERVRSRYKALAKPYEQKSDESTLVVALSLLEGSMEKLNQKSDDILAFLESSGLGRVLDHHMLCDHMDSIEDDESDY